MNENDIRKAKEYFIYGITHDIFSSPVISHAKTALMAFGEINRQKAKIKALEMDNSQLQSDIINANMNCEHMQAEIERLEELLSGAKQCIAEMEYAIDKVGLSNSRIDDALEEWNNFLKEMVGER